MKQKLWTKEESRIIYKSRTKQVQPIKDDILLSYIMGVVKGDGYITFSKGYHVGLNTIDRFFAFYFKKSLEKWSQIKSGKVLKYYSPANNYKNKFYSVRFYSLNLCNILNSIDVQKVVSKNRNTKIAFLQGIFDSEGWVSRYHIGMSMNNIIFINFCYQILKSLGGNGKVRIYTSKKGYKMYAIILEGKNRMRWFNDNIKFNIPCKQNKLTDSLNLYLSDKEINFYRSLPIKKRRYWRGIKYG